jgi:exonuclease SbcC
MRLLELELENFRQYAHATVAFETGITAIVGANGAGKTTLVEAILWALYGATAARGTSDTLRFMWSEGGARVQVRLEFQLGNTRYQVVRTDKDASLSQWRNGVLSTLARGVRPVTESVQKLLGMTLHQFQTSFCARQKELEFMSYAPERRREEISRMLGYERIGKALDSITQHAKSLGDEIKGLQQGLGNRELLQQQINQAQQTIAERNQELAILNEQYAHAQAKRQEATRLLQEAQLKKQAHDALQNQIRLLESQRAHLEAQIEQLRERWNRIQQAQKRRRELQPNLERYKTVQKRLRELEELAQSEQKRAALQAHIEQLIRQIESLQRQLQDYAEKEKQLQQLQPAVQQAQQLEAELKRLRQQAEQAAQRSRLEAELNALTERLHALQALQPEAEQLANEMAQSQQRCQQLDAQRATLQAKMEQLQQAWHKERAEAEAALKTQEAHLAQLQQREEQLRSLGAESECPTCGQPLGDAYHRLLAQLQSTIEAEHQTLHQLQRTLESLQQEPETLQATRRQLQQLETEREQALQRLSSQQTRHQELQKQLGELPTLQAQIETLCAQIAQILPYDPEQEQRLHDELERLKPLLQEATMLTAQLKQKPLVERELHARQRERQQYERQLAHLPTGYDPLEHEALRAEHEQLRPLYEEALQLKTLIEEKPATRAQIEQAKLQKLKKESQLQQVQSELQALGFCQQEYEQQVARYQEADEQVRQLQNRIASLQAERDASCQHLAQLQAQLEQIREREELLKRKQAELLLHETLRKAMQAFRTELNQRLRPTLASHATEFLTHLTGGRYTQLELDEEYHFQLVDDGMRKAVISGGEEDIVNLCMRLALARLITERAGQPLSLLILDEVFGSLDTDRRQNVLMLLNNLRDWFEQILIISHIEEINEAADRTLYVVRNERTRTSQILERRAESLLLDNGGL